MKKIIILLLGVCLVLGLAACTPSSSEETGDPETPSWTNPYDGITLSDYVTLGQYKDFTVSVKKEEVTQDMLDYYTMYYLSQEIEAEDTDRTVVEDGDTVTISFDGFIDGEPSDEASSEESVVIIGYTSLIPGFAEGLVGHSVGDTFSLDLTFPEDYNYEDVAGKPVRFDVEILKLQNSIIPTKEEFAVAQGFDDFAAFENDLRSYLEEYAVSRYESDLTDAVMTLVIEGCEKLEIPAAVYDRYYEEVKKSYGSYVETYNSYYNDDMTWEEYYYAQNLMTPEDATKSDIRTELVLFRIAELENLTLTDEFFEEEINNLVAYYAEQYFMTYTAEDIIESFGRDFLNFQFTADYVRKWVTSTVTNTEMTAD